jgi:transcriptional regulator with PAS, ATPase and Fis domain
MDALVRRALDALAGPALLLDRNLRVVACTASAEELLGVSIRRGMSLPKILCGDSPVKPVAEALAAGRSISARVVRPGRGGRQRALDVRATALEDAGFLVVLEEVREPGEARGGATEFHGLWTRDASMRAMFSIVEKAARSDATVLLRGETGTGKELLARAIHDLSRRRGGPFHAINCAAISPALLESELFGHVRGAFTGAVRDAPGHFRLASGGTLMLDEVAELPLELQAKLLRVLQTRSVIPVGGAEAIPVDVRVVSATHRALRREVDAGRFRADLMYRLRVVPIFIPPLRERGDDVLLLAERIIERLNAREERHVDRISAAAKEALLAHGWPGNVRELENALEYAYVVGGGPVLDAHELPPEVVHPGEELRGTPVNAPPPLGEHSGEAARIARALERSGGSRTRAAQLLGISRVTLWRKMRELHVDTPIEADVSQR